MTFDKKAQAARAAAMSGGYSAPLIKPTKLRVFNGDLVGVGDTVVHPTVSGSHISLTKRTVTEVDLQNGRIKLDNSSQWVTKIQRLVKYEG